MTLTLRITNTPTLPDGGPVSFTAEGAGFEFGRDSAMDWTLPDPQRFVSSCHGEVKFENGGYWLYDLSTNGTFVNGSAARMKSPYALRAGDRIQVGTYVLLVETADAPASAAQLAAFGSGGDTNAPAGGDIWSLGGGSDAPVDPGFNPVPPPPRQPDFGDQHIAFTDTPSAAAAPEPDPVPAPAPMAGPAAGPVAAPPALSTAAAQPSTADASPFLDGPAAAAPAPVAAPLPDAIPRAEVDANPAPMPRPAAAPRGFGSSSAQPSAAFDIPQAVAPATIAKAGPLPDPSTGAPLSVAVPGSEDVQPVFPGDAAKPQVITHMVGAAAEEPDAARAFGLPPGRAMEARPAMETPAAEPVPTPAPPPNPTEAGADAAALLRTFCEGAGLRPDAFDGTDPHATAHEIGRAMRIMTAELAALLRARTTAKLSFRSGSRTEMSHDANNPLKFVPAAEEALEVMFGKPRPGYQRGAAAVQASFSDITRHQSAVFAAIQPALAEVLSDLAPETIQAKVETGRFSNRAAKAWELYVQRWDAKTAPHDHGMLDVFNLYFAKAYDVEVNRKK